MRIIHGIHDVIMMLHASFRILFIFFDNIFGLLN